MKNSINRTVLIVDDCRFTRAKLEGIFKSEGYAVVAHAMNGNEAVEQYQSLKPDVVTMDIEMPAMDGIEAAKQILKIDPTARIIMISSIGIKRKVQEAFEVGVKGFILKPFQSQQVVDTIEKLFVELNHAEV